MPCDTIQTVGVKLTAATDLDLLVKALSALNLSPYLYKDQGLVTFGNGESFDKATGELRIRFQETVAQIKRAYSAEVVKAQAKRYGWQIKETAPFQYQVTKR